MGNLMNTTKEDTSSSHEQPNIIALTYANELTESSGTIPQGNIVINEEASNSPDLEVSSMQESSQNFPQHETSNKEEKDEISQTNQKALEFLEVTEEEEKQSEESELDVKKLTENILSILNEDRIDSELSKDQLLAKIDDLQSFISKLVEKLTQKTEFCIRLERQNFALINQAKTLKNVVAITKDLLGLRNMEVEHLHADLKVMEESISTERKRHDLLLQKLSEAMGLNEQLKNEYHTQSGLFQSLREKYHEKILLLTKENQRLENIISESKVEDAPLQESGKSDCITEIIEK